MPIHDPVPICLDCHRRMSCLKNGVIVKQTYDDGTPYCFQHTDMYECAKCGKRHVSGFSTNSINNHSLSFNEENERWEAQEDQFKVWWS